MEIRTCTSAEELRDAVGAIVHYFGREKPDDAWTERWLKVFELERMHAAVEDDGSIVGGAGALVFRMTVPGGVSAADRRRDGRRRPADASAARRPPLDDAHPARRRARAR